MPKGYTSTGERLRGALSPAQKANITRMKARSSRARLKAHADATRYTGPTESWWITDSHRFYERAHQEAFRMGAAAQGPNYRIKAGDGY